MKKYDELSNKEKHNFEEFLGSSAFISVWSFLISRYDTSV